MDLGGEVRALLDRSKHSFHADTSPESAKSSNSDSETSRQIERPQFL